MTENPAQAPSTRMPCPCECHFSGSLSARAIFSARYFLISSVTVVALVSVIVHRVRPLIGEGAAGGQTGRFRAGGTSTPRAMALHVADPRFSGRHAMNLLPNPGLWALRRAVLPLSHSAGCV
jgi:hypothetical protein